MSDCSSGEITRSSSAPEGVTKSLRLEMDLTQPPLDYLADIDRKLQQVSEETQLMREKFGFTADMNEAETIMAIKKKAKQVIQPKRYDDKGSGASHQTSALTTRPWLT